MSEKIGRAYHRCDMLERFMKRNLSQATQEKICFLFGVFKNYPDSAIIREELAKQINEIIDTSETEEEILERVSRL